MRRTRGLLWPPEAYLTRSEFLERVRGGEGLRAAIDRTTSAPGRDIRFDYLAWRYFNEYLREKHGENAFRLFLAGYLRDHAASRHLFAEAYSMRLEDAIRAFQREVSAGTWTPRP